MPVAVHQPRQHRAPAQVQRGLAGSRVDVAAPPAKATRPSRITSESTTEPAASIV